MGASIVQNSTIIHNNHDSCYFTNVFLRLSDTVAVVEPWVHSSTFNSNYHTITATMLILKYQIVSKEDCAINKYTSGNFR